ncbi:hypothetical protein C8F01DRAFT_1167433 [Mycena amicta]|nr:hypothetical protein C8F01DRAFT_1167433 [Mycena amicta]
MFSCIYSTSPASPSTMPCSSSASSLASLDIPGAWKSAYSGRGRSNASSPLESPSASRLPSISSATPAFRPTASKSDSVAFATASSSALLSPAAFTEPECYYSSAPSETRLRVSSISTIPDVDTPVPSTAVPVVHIPEAQPVATSPNKSHSKAGIYGGRRGPTSRSVTSTLPAKLGSTTARDPNQRPALAPVPREMHLRVRVPSIRRHRTTSSKIGVGRDMTFGGVIPRGRESSGLRIAVLMRVGMLADRRAKKLLEERAKEMERLEEMEKTVIRNKVMGGMLEMGRDAEREELEERMEMIGRKVQEVKRRRQGMDMEAVLARALARKTTKGQIQGGQEGPETDWVMV